MEQALTKSPTQGFQLHSLKNRTQGSLFRHSDATKIAQLLVKYLA